MQRADDGLSLASVTTGARFRIGDFSQLGQVSVRTLRHYDELGLLEPAYTDPLTDYRYYAIEQLPRLNRIVALKDLGFSLKEIRDFLKQSVSLSELREMLEHKHLELTEQLRSESARLTRLQARLKHIETEHAPLGYDVTLKRVAATTIFSKRYAVPDLSEMDIYCTRFYTELYTVLKAQKLVPVAPEFILYHTREYVTQNVDIEVAVVLGQADAERLELPRDESFTVRRLQGAPTAASIMFEGHFNDLGGAARALMLWTGINGYESAGAAREVHLSGPVVETGKDKPVVIELQVPVARRGAAQDRSGG